MDTNFLDADYAGNFGVVNERSLGRISSQYKDKSKKAKEKVRVGKNMKSKLSIILVVVCLSTGCTGPISERHHEEPQGQLYSLDNKDRLVQMAEKRFGKLTEADKILFTAVADGTLADYTEGGDKDKVENVDSWGERRIIDANRIEWLCLDKNAKELVTDMGIQVMGAKIVGAVDLGYAEVPIPLTFGRCVFNEEINMNSSRIKFLILTGSRTGPIRADGIKVEVGVFLRDGFKANGEVRFLGAIIGGDFDCTNGEFINEGGKAIIAERMDVKGTVFLKNGFKANGEIRFMGAAIGGDFDCTNGKFINKGGAAIIADRIEVKGTVFLTNGFKANGEVRFPGAVIGGNFVCENGEFINEDGRAI
jgi:sRNA-binding regulator protein Hfq